LNGQVACPVEHTLSNRDARRRIFLQPKRLGPKTGHLPLTGDQPAPGMAHLLHLQKDRKLTFKNRSGLFRKEREILVTYGGRKNAYTT
jgi:hypothetical protein